MRSFFASVVLACLGIQSAWACSCVRSGSWQEVVRDADAVFVGEAIQTVKDSDSAENSDEHITTFRISRALKGRPVETRLIHHGVFTPGCGRKFAAGEVYEVYAYRREGVLRTGLCSATKIVRPFDFEAEFRESLERIEGYDTGKQLEWKVEALDRIVQEKEKREFFEDYTGKLDLIYSPPVKEKLRPEFLIELGDMAMTWRDFERAGDAFLAALRHTPGDPVIVLRLAGPLGELGDWQTIHHHAGESLDRNPLSPKLRRLAAQARLAHEGVVSTGAWDFAGMRIVSKNLDGIRANNADFSKAKITDTSFFRASLHDTSFDEAELANVAFVEAHLEGASFVDTRNKDYSVPPDFSRADLRGAKFVRAEIWGVNFHEAKFDKAVFDHVNGRGVSFDSASMGSIRIQDSTFSSSNFSGVVVKRASLRNVDLRYSNLTGANFSDSTLENVELAAARIDCETKWPYEIDQRKEAVLAVEPQCNGVPQNRDFSGMEWPWGTDFSDLDLRGSDFRGATITRAKFHRADLTSSDFSGSSGRSDFAGADLTDAVFGKGKHEGYFGSRRRGHFSDTALAPAVLGKTDFSGAHLGSGSFVSGDERDTQPDLSTAILTNVTFTCSHVQRWGGFSREERLAELAELDDPSSEIRTVLTEEQIQRRREGLIGQLPESRIIAAREKALIDVLKDKWPGTQFDNTCDVYFQTAAE